MSGRVVSADIQTGAEGERLYVWYNTDANALYSLWNDNKLMIFGEKIKLKVDVN